MSKIVNLAVAKGEPLSELTYVKCEPISLESHPKFNEKWVQDLIANDPSILGLGELELRDKERVQPRAGRLDLLLQDPDNNKRYEVEIQLGKTDESHIIRTIEYWDIERKRYPQYDHAAVIVSENITSRFLNVISLFNGTIPLIAIQMNALKINNTITLSFTKVLNEVNQGLVDEDETVRTPVNRAYWEDRASKVTVSLVDQMLEVFNSIGANFELNYTKYYIGLSDEGRSSAFVSLRPRKNAVVAVFWLDKEMRSELEEEDLDIVTFDERNSQFHIRISPEQFGKKKDYLKKLFQISYEKWKRS